MASRCGRAVSNLATTGEYVRLHGEKERERKRVVEVVVKSKARFAGNRVRDFPEAEQ